MDRHQSSLTAEGIAFIRAWESLKPAGERVCYDPLARHFIGPLMWALGKPKRLYFTGPNAHRPVAPTSAIVTARVAPCM